MTDDVGPYVPEGYTGNAPSRARPPPASTKPYLRIQYPLSIHCWAPAHSRNEVEGCRVEGT